MVMIYLHLLIVHHCDWFAGLSSLPWIIYTFILWFHCFNFDSLGGAMILDRLTRLSHCEWSVPVFLKPFSCKMMNFSTFMFSWKHFVRKMKINLWQNMLWYRISIRCFSCAPAGYVFSIRNTRFKRCYGFSENSERSYFQFCKLWPCTFLWYLPALVLLQFRIGALMLPRPNCIFSW